MINSMLPSLFFDVRSLQIFDVTSLQIFDVKLVSMLQFSMFPYSMLPTSIKNFLYHFNRLKYYLSESIIVTVPFGQNKIKQICINLTTLTTFQQFFKEFRSSTQFSNMFVSFCRYPQKSTINSDLSEKTENQADNFKPNDWTRIKASLHCSKKRDRFMNRIILPPTRKKVVLEFFALRINRFWEKALDLQTLIGNLAQNIFPDFEVP